MLAAKLFLAPVSWKCCFDKPVTTFWCLFCIFILFIVSLCDYGNNNHMGQQAIWANERNICNKVNSFCQCEPYNFQKTANYHDPGSVASVKTEHNKVYVWSKCVLLGIHKRCLPIISQECGVIYAACEQDLKKRDNWLTWQTSLHPLPVLKYRAASQWSLIVPVQAHSMD